MLVSGSGANEVIRESRLLFGMSVLLRSSNVLDVDFSNLIGIMPGLDDRAIACSWQDGSVMTWVDSWQFCSIHSLTAAAVLIVFHACMFDTRDPNASQLHRMRCNLTDASADARMLESSFVIHGPPLPPPPFSATCTTRTITS